MMGLYHARTGKAVALSAVLSVSFALLGPLEATVAADRSISAVLKVDASMEVVLDGMCNWWRVPARILCAGGSGRRGVWEW